MIRGSLFSGLHRECSLLYSRRRLCFVKISSKASWYSFKSRPPTGGSSDPHRFSYVLAETRLRDSKLDNEVTTNVSTMTQQPRGNRFIALEKQLVSQRDRLRFRLGEQRRGVFGERERDDEIVAAYENLSKDMLISTLERERKTLDEIELALVRMRSGDYGICRSCSTTIPGARLRALPWAQCCVQCAAGRSAPHTSAG
jgi:DnaK suppressor protein